MKKIPLSRGKVAVVDDHRFEELNQYKWYCLAIGYAARSVWKNGKTDHMVYMHRVVNNTPKGMITDHINQDKLDNRECNLRNATKSLNGFNRPSKGVDYHKKAGKWRARVQGKHLGWFKTENEALAIVKQKRKGITV